MDARALRVHRAEHVIDRAVLARRIERLQADEERVLALRIEEVLQVAQFLVQLLHRLDGGFLPFVLGGEVGIDLLEPDIAARFDAEEFAVFHGGVEVGATRCFPGFRRPGTSAGAGSVC